MAAKKLDLHGCRSKYNVYMGAKPHGDFSVYDPRTNMLQEIFDMFIYSFHEIS